MNEGVVELAKEADEEARRLLYVGLTRARDLLIQALAEKTQEGGLLESLGPEAATLLKPAVQGTTSLTDMKCPPSSGLLLPASFLERLMVEETEEGLFDD